VFESYTMKIRRTKFKLKANEDGFTLIELLVVLGIIALLMTLVAPQVIRYLSEAKSETALIQMKNIESALEMYYLDTGQYPDEQNGLKALVEAPNGVKNWSGPYLKRDKGVVDPWGKPFIFKAPGEHGSYDISTLGRDAAPGGTGENKDISNWQ
jgi:general secretion pathway protein G